MDDVKWSKCSRKWSYWLLYCDALCVFPILPSSDSDQLDERAAYMHK